MFLNDKEIKTWGQKNNWNIIPPSGFLNPA